MARKVIISELKKEIVDFYLDSPTTIKNVCCKFNLSAPTVIKILKGINKYSKNTLFNPNFNENYFEHIDTEEKAYFLGILIADGNVFKSVYNSASISLTLSTKDRYILEKFKQELKTSTKIIDFTRGLSSVAVRSMKMMKDLEKYGVVPRKTLITYLPKIDLNLLNHLIRGIFDGDGSLQFKPVQGRCLHDISFCGTHKLMEDIAITSTNILKLKYRPRVYDYKSGTYSEIKFKNFNDIILFGNWMYNNATIFLHRKKNKFDRLKDYYYNKHGNTEVISEITKGSETP